MGTTRLHGVFRVLRASVYLLGAYPLFVGLAYAAVLATDSGVVDVNWLVLNSSNFWGIVTSIFVHQSWEHFYNDAAGILQNYAFLELICLGAVRFQGLSRRGAAALFVGGPFLSTLFANFVIWTTYVTPGYGRQNVASLGSSGVFYSMFGVMLMASACVIAQAARFIWEHRNEPIPKKLPPTAFLYLLFLAFCIIIFLGSLALMADPMGFLAIRAGNGSDEHFLSFVLGMVGAGLFSSKWAGSDPRIVSSDPQESPPPSIPDQRGNQAFASIGFCVSEKPGPKE